MAILTKAQLEALNQSSFPDQSTEAITPAILRNYNTQTIDTLVDSLDTGSFTTSAITASSLITASVNLNTITFTKGNGSTFDVTVNTGSGGGGTTDISSLNAFTASQLTINSGLNASTASQQVSINNLNSTTASINSSITQLNASSASQQISINALNTNSGSVNSSITQLNASSASQQISINALNAATSSYVTSAITASSLITASFSVNTLTFTKGNGDTFGVVIPDVSGSGVPAGTISGSVQIVELGFLQTSSFNAYTASTDSSITQLNASSASQQISIDALNTTSASLNTSASLGLTTASFSGNTLTFTKGNGTTFGLVIPDVSGSTLPSGLLSSSVTNFTDYSASVDSRINAITSSGGIPTGTVSSSAQITSLGFVSSSVTASSLVTASFSGNTLTFTKGDASTFGVVIPDVSGSTIPAGTVSSSAQILNYGIFATTGSNTFIGNQTISSSLFISGNISMVNGSDLITHHVRAAGSNGLELQTSAGTTIVAMGAGGGTQAVFVGAVSANSISASTINGLGDPLAFSTSVDSRLDGLEAATSSYVTSAITASSLVTASFSGNTLTFTKGDASTFGVVIPDVSGSTIDTGSFATTGSNVFTGDQTLTDGAGNTVTLSDISGSLVLVAKGLTSGSAGLSNVITSGSNLVNLIFKNNSNQSGSIILSGSNNLIGLPQTPTAGFRRQLQSNNIILNSQIPEVTGSADHPININGNLASSAMRFRGPVSSSTWAFNNNILHGGLNVGSTDSTPANQAIAGGSMGNNILIAGLNYNAYTTPLLASANFTNTLVVGPTTLTAFSSSIQANNNIFNGNQFAVNNSYFGTASTNAAQRLALAYNVFGGLNSSTLTASGSNTSTSAAREVIGNTTNGSGNLLGVVLNGDNSNLYSTLIHGSNLTVTGSNAYNTYATAGSTFIGRNNSVNGTAARSGETIFAVGTGTGTSVRKTGFLIDSGSNTFIEGTLNVSGSTSFNGAVNITGSLTSSLTEGYVWVGGAGNVSTLVATSSFAGGSVPAGTVSSSAQILGYNIFATTGSNTFVATQINKAGLKFEQATGGSDNYINLASLNESTLYIQNTSVSSGYNSGSVLQLTTSTGSNGYGGSGSAVFQMDAVYDGNTSAMKVGSAPGRGSYVLGLADNISFAKAEGFPNTPSTTFRVDALSIELSGSVKVNTGSSGSAGIVSVGSGGTTVNNGLVTSNSIILATTQELGSGDEYPAVVSGKTNGSFTLNHNFGGSLNVAYLIINPIT